jgi:hypothetical protein
MKLRIENDTLRLRLSNDEVRAFAETGSVSAAIHFGPELGQQLTYALERSSQVSKVLVRYEPGALTVVVPAAIAAAWTSTDQNGFAQQLTLAQGQQLRILVEKDLDCRH